MDRVTRVRAELSERKSFARRAGEAGPPCLTCRYKTLLGMCGNPAYAKQSFDAPSGRYSEAFETPVGAARADDGLCGPEAVLWDDMSLPQAYWRETKAFAEAHPWFSLAGAFGLWWGVSLLL